MSALTIRFDGLCCHVTPVSGDRFKKRTIVPAVHDHISYIEFFADDFDPAKNPDFPAGTVTAYPRDLANYKRIEVSDVRLEVKNVTSDGNVIELDTYHQRIPKLTQVASEFRALKASLRADPPASGLAAIFFDMPGGILSAGPPERFKTEFIGAHAWPIRRLGEWAQLDVQIVGPPIIEITSLADGTKKTLTLDDGADLITIGNQTEHDILGIQPEPGEGGHFVAYYDLSETVLVDPPRPSLNLGLGVGCTNTNYP